MNLAVEGDDHTTHVLRARDNRGRAAATRTEHDAAYMLQQHVREWILHHKLACHAERLRNALHHKASRHAVHEDSDTESAEDEALKNTCARVWPFIREVSSVLAGAVLLTLIAPAAPWTLHGLYEADLNATVVQQLTTALRPAALLVTAFAIIFAVLLGFYVADCTALLHVAHGVWLALLLGLPAHQLTRALCSFWHVVLDAPSASFLVWNYVTVGVVVVQWPRLGGASFERLRRRYAFTMATVGGWAMSAMPWQVALDALLLLSAMDLFLVLPRHSPVRTIDRLANGLELGIGDFVIYASLVAFAAQIRLSTSLAASLGVLAGLLPTMMALANAKERLMLPALPAAVTLGLAALLLESALIWPLSQTLQAAHGFV